MGICWGKGHILSIELTELLGPCFVVKVHYLRPPTCIRGWKLLGYNSNKEVVPNIKK
jgi:hypothetical protein